jgi:hypothetical protein
LIDRNDELCILYEKANIQENIFKNGEGEMIRKDDEIRFFKREIAELRRKIEVTLGRIPSLTVYERSYKELQRLENELKAERTLTAQLCEKLENPSALDSSGTDASVDDRDEHASNSVGVTRCRQLKGIDPEPEQLAAKIEVLQDRLNDKKEQLLEKDLILDEVSSLSDKLRMQAAESRGSTLELAKKVNDYQSKIRNITRKMMATISELSMYQATAMKLQHQKTENENLVNAAREKLANGAPPTDDAEYEWFRMERDRMRRQEAMIERINNEKNFQSNAQKAAQGQLVRTTAIARPNHYLPEELALPKPYGQLQPFKPTVPGANMRHIRKPVPKEIQI